MHVEQVEFEQVFDVQAGRGDFSFTSKGRSHYGVNLYRGMIPRAGATYLVAFAEKANWSSVLGWRDCAGGASELRQPLWHGVVTGIESLLWLGPFLVLGALLFGGQAAALAVLLAICSFAGVRVYRIAERNRAIRRALQR